jgi:predicted negative regulator of RcsB-dependent stress response
MQTQDASAEFLFKLWPWLEANKNRLIGVAVAAVVLWGVVYFFSSQKAQREIDAGQAMTTVAATAGPGETAQLAGQFQQLADKYSGTAAGNRAILQAAGALFATGNFPDAQAQFQKYLDANGSGALAATAQLGIAACLEAQNKLDQAASAYQRVVSAYPDSPSVPMAQLALGRISEQQNKMNEALNHYEDASRSPYGGSIAQEGMIRATEIKAKIAATTPKPAASAKPAPAATPAFSPLLTQPAAK